MEEGKLYPHQPSGIEFLANSYGALLGDIQGSGKTVMVINAAKRLNGPILCVVRPLAKPDLVAHIKEWDPGTPIVRCIEGGAFNEEVVKKWFEFPRKRGYLLVHHEVVRRIVGVLKSFGLWEAIWVDEAHRISNSHTQLYKSLMGIQSFYKWGTTGTPIDKLTSEFWGILHWIRPAYFNSYWSFYENFVQEVRDSHGKVLTKHPKNLPLFAKLVGPYYLRREEEEVGMYRPEYIPVHLEMSPEQQQVYSNLEGQVVADILADEGNDENLFVASSLARLHHLKIAALEPAILGSRAPGVKIDWLRDWVKDYSDPLIIFTHSKAFARYLPSVIADGLPIHGDMTITSREKVLDLFKNGKIRYVVATIDTAAESLNLQVSSHAIFTDAHPSSRMMSQAEMRIRRINSVRRATVYQLCCTKSIDVDLWRAYNQKLTDRQLIDDFIRRYNEGNSH